MQPPEDGLGRCCCSPLAPLLPSSLVPLPLSLRVHRAPPPPFPPSSSSLSSAEQIGAFAHTPLTSTAKRGRELGFSSARRGGRTSGEEAEEEAEEPSGEKEDEALLRSSLSFAASAFDHTASSRLARIVPWLKAKNPSKGPRDSRTEAT